MKGLESADYIDHRRASIKTLEIIKSQLEEEVKKDSQIAPTYTNFHIIVYTCIIIFYMLFIFNIS